MRYIITLFGSLILFFCAHAQLPDSILHYQWQPYNGNRYVFDGYTKFSYNINCELDSALTYSYSNSTPQNAGLITITYSSNIQQEIQYGWINYSWVSQYRFTRYLNAFKSTDSLIIDRWENGAWSTYSADRYSYDSNNLITTYISQYWYTPSGWSDSYKRDYLYNNNYNAIRTLNYNYNSLTKNWQPYSKDTLVYTPFQKLQSDTNKSWIDSNWVNSTLQTNSYDSLNRLSNYLFQNWTNYPTPYLVNLSRTFLTYNDGDTLPVQEEYQNWRNNAWENDIKNITAYKNCSSVLPLQFIGFTALRNNSLVTLHWQTSNETNVSSFSIQRSVDGVNFITIGHTAATGGNNSLMSYVYNDNISQLTSGKLYYRLQIENRDGTAQLSDTKIIDNELKFTASVNPNPIKGNSFTLNFFNPTPANIEISIYDMQGRNVLTQHYNLPAGNISKLITIDNISRGLYLLHVNGGSRILAIKLLKE